MGCCEDFGEGADGLGWIGDAVWMMTMVPGAKEEDEEQGEKQVPHTARKMRERVRDDNLDGAVMVGRFGLIDLG